MPVWHVGHRFQSLRSISRSACRHGTFLVLIAGSSLLTASAFGANTAIVVASEPTTTQTNPPNLNDGASYTGGNVPGTTNDVVFNASNNYSQPEPSGYTPALGVFSPSAALSIGSVNDLSTSQAITLSNGNASTQAPVTLNGGNSVSGNTADLLYVATGATLNISNVKPATGATGNTVSLNLGVSGNFDVVGTAKISVPIQSGTISAPTVNPNGLTKTGAGTLTFTAANLYSGTTTVNAGTLTVDTGGRLGSGAVTVNSGGTLLTSGSGTLGTGTSVTVAGTGALTLQSTNSFNSAQTLRFAQTSTITLNNSTADTLQYIVDTNTPGVALAAGTYTAAQLNSTFGVTSFTGSGSLTVTAIPEPATWLGGLMLVGTLGVRFRRQWAPAFARASHKR